MFANTFRLPLAACIVLAAFIGQLNAETTKDTRRVFVVPYRAWPMMFRTRIEPYAIAGPGGEKITKTRVVGYVTSVPQSRTRTVFPGLEWRGVLRHAAAQRELKFSDEQSATVKELLDDARTLISGDRKGIFERIDELNERLNQLFTVSQRKRLDELMYRRALSRNWPGGNPPFGAATKLWGGATDDRDWYEELISPLSKRQRQQIAEYLREGYLDCYRKCKPLVIAQMHFPSEDISAIRSTSIDALGYDFSGLDAPNSFDWYSKRYYTLSFVSQGGRLKGGASFALGHFCLSNIPELTEEQRIDISKVIDGIEGDYHKELKPLIAKATGRVVDILNESQKRDLEARCIQEGVKRRGVYASLMNGELRERLAVSPQQRKEIEVIANKLRARMAKIELALVKESFEKSLARLGDEERIKARERMGESVRWRP